MWQTAEHLTVLGSALSVLGTVLALWLAIGVSSRMAYHAAHGKQMNAKEYANILWAHSAVLATAIPVLLLLGISGLGILSLKVALFSAMILLLLSFVMFSFFAGRRIHTTWKEIMVTSLFEILLGVGVIVLKIVVGH